jgi:hypothetical protein
MLVVVVEVLLLALAFLNPEVPEVHLLVELEQILQLREQMGQQILVLGVAGAVVMLLERLPPETGVPVL